MCVDEIVKCHVRSQRYILCAMPDHGRWRAKGATKRPTTASHCELVESDTVCGTSFQQWVSRNNLSLLLSSSPGDDDDNVFCHCCDDDTWCKNAIISTKTGTKLAPGHYCYYYADIHPSCFEQPIQFKKFCAYTAQETFHLPPTHPSSLLFSTFGFVDPFQGRARYYTKECYRNPNFTQ